MGLTNHTQPISHHIMPLAINALRADTQTHIPTCQQKQFQETRHMQPVAACTWFNKKILIILCVELRIIFCDLILLVLEML